MYRVSREGRRASIGDPPGTPPRSMRQRVPSGMSSFSSQRFFSPGGKDKKFGLSDGRARFGLKVAGLLFALLFIRYIHTNACKAQADYDAALFSGDALTHARLELSKLQAELTKERKTRQSIENELDDLKANDRGKAGLPESGSPGQQRAAEAEAEQEMEEDLDNGDKGVPKEDLQALVEELEQQIGIKNEELTRSNKQTAGLLDKVNSLEEQLKGIHQRSTRGAGDEVSEDQDPDPPREPPVMLPLLMKPGGAIEGHDPREFDATEEERSKSGVPAEQVNGDDVTMDGIEIDGIDTRDASFRSPLQDESSSPEMREKEESFFDPSTSDDGGIGGNENKRGSLMPAADHSGGDGSSGKEERTSAVNGEDLDGAEPGIGAEPVREAPADLMVGDPEAASSTDPVSDIVKGPKSSSLRGAELGRSKDKGLSEKQSKNFLHKFFGAEKDESRRHGNGDGINEGDGGSGEEEEEEEEVEEGGEGTTEEPSETTSSSDYDGESGGGFGGEEDVGQVRTWDEQKRWGGKKRDTTTSGSDPKARTESTEQSEEHSRERARSPEKSKKPFVKRGEHLDSQETTEEGEMDDKRATDAYGTSMDGGNGLFSLDGVVIEGALEEGEADLVSGTDVDGAVLAGSREDQEDLAQSEFTDEVQLSKESYSTSGDGGEAGAEAVEAAVALFPLRQEAEEDHVVIAEEDEAEEEEKEEMVEEGRGQGEEPTSGKEGVETIDATVVVDQQTKPEVPQASSAHKQETASPGKPAVVQKDLAEGALAEAERVAAAMEEQTRVVETRNTGNEKAGEEAADDLAAKRAANLKAQGEKERLEKENQKLQALLAVDHEKAIKLEAAERETARAKESELAAKREVLQLKEAAEEAEAEAARLNALLYRVNESDESGESTSEESDFHAEGNSAGRARRDDAGSGHDTVDSSGEHRGSSGARGEGSDGVESPHRSSSSSSSENEQSRPGGSRGTSQQSGDDDDVDDDADSGDSGLESQRAQRSPPEEIPEEVLAARDAETKQALKMLEARRDRRAR